MRNAKLEIRNKSQSQRVKSKTRNQAVWDIGILAFGFVSDFELRISDLDGLPPFAYKKPQDPYQPLPLRCPVMPLRKWMLVLALVSWFLVPRLAAAGSSGEEEDEKTLARAHVRSEGSALLDFLQKRTLSEAEREHLEQQVQDLGNKK